MKSFKIIVLVLVLALTAMGSAQACNRVGGNCEGGGDIILWDIVDSVAPAPDASTQSNGRPAGGGGNGGGGDIIIWDIVDSATP